eukprot:gene31830-biopygen6686
MLAFHKSLLPSHGLQGGLHSSSNFNSTCRVNDRSPRPFQSFDLGSQQGMPLSPVCPRQGGAQSKASSVCWAKKKKTKEVQNAQQKAKGFGKQASKAEGPSVQQESKTDADTIDSYFEGITLSEGFSEWMDDTIYDHMPPACDAAWKESQQAWFDLAMDHPITLNNGECTVHLFGIAHDIPTHASALKALVDTVKPDTIAIEMPPQLSKQLRALAQELAPQLDKLMALGLTAGTNEGEEDGLQDVRLWRPAGIREAYTALSPQDRCQWRKLLFEGNLAMKVGPEYASEKIDLMIHGRVALIEYLAAARLAPSGNDGISLEGIDMDESSKAKRVLQDLGYQQEYELQMQQLRGSNDSFHEQCADPAFDEWQKTVATMEHLKNIDPLNDGLVSMPPNWEAFINLLGFVSVSLTVEEESRVIQKEVVSLMTGKAAAYAQTLWIDRDLGMLNRLRQLAEGRWSAGGPLRPRKCIVAVVGQNHVTPMRELAARNKM